MNESDPRSDVHYLGSSENKAWKNFQACTGILILIINILILFPNPTFKL